MSITVREATLEDAEAIATVDIASHQAAYGDIFNHVDPSRRDFEPVLSRWQDILSSDRESRLPRVVLVAVKGEEIVGYSTVGHSRDEGGQGLGEVLTMYVTPARWRQGIGHQLMRSATDWLRDQRFEAATLWVLEDNARARAFYEKEGWQADGAREVVDSRLPGLTIANVRYRKRVI